MNHNHHQNGRPQRSNQRQFVNLDLPVVERENLDHAVTMLSGCPDLIRLQPQVGAALETLKRANAMVKLTQSFK